MLAEDRFAQQVEDPVLRIVLVHRDLLEHDLALGLELAEARAPDHVGHHVERALEVPVEHAGVQGGGLLVGPRVHLSPHRVEDLVDLLRAVALGAPEQHVLEQVEIPAWLSRLAAEPVAIQKPSATERTLGTRSVTTRTPESSVVVRCSSGISPSEFSRGRAHDASARSLAAPHGGDHGRSAHGRFAQRPRAARDRLLRRPCR